MTRAATNTCERCVTTGADGKVWFFEVHPAAAPAAIEPTWTSLGSYDAP